MPENSDKERLKKWMGLWAEIDKVYTAFLKKWELSLNTYWVVEYLRTHPHGAEPTELADKLNVMRQLITIILNDLEKRGYILRSENKTDHRKRNIVLSKQGMLFAEEVGEAMDAVDLQSLSAFTPEERDLMVEHSRRFCDALKAATTNSSIPSI